MQKNTKSNLEGFPKLKKDQVALMRVENSTGIVLDDYLKWATAKTQKVYTIYDNVQDALNTAKLIVQQKENVECIIYEVNEKMLYMITPQNINSLT